MSEIKIISRESLAIQARDNKVLPNRGQMAHIVTPGIKIGGDNDENWAAMVGANAVANESIMPSMNTLQKYGSAFDVPKAFTVDGKKVVMSTREAIVKGVFASANTLPEDWQTMWDAMRIDISIRKAARGTVRESFYNVVNMPNSTKTFKADDFYPYATIFEENNGEGQAVNQGETRLGQSETLEHFIYAAGWTWTLLAELFANSIDPQKITDSVINGYNAKRDDLSMAPILNFSYAGVQQTPAATLSGANRQELLYLTLEDAIDDLGDRDDPITDRPIDPMGAIILAHPYDTRHIARVANGLPSTNERIYPGISEIGGVVAYDTEVIRGRVKDVTYSGVTKGTAYLVKPNRYMNVGIKRGLTLETEMTPDVSTLAREKRAWYFAEAQQTTGIQYFVQEITLPTW